MEDRVVKITYRGWGGHYICADRCLFKLNTLLECEDEKVIVSTVGMMRDVMTKEIAMIGCDRYYETMAFLGKEETINYKKDMVSHTFIDADVTNELAFSGVWSYNKISDEWFAQQNHERIVEEFRIRLLNGEKFVKPTEDNDERDE